MLIRLRMQTARRNWAGLGQAFAATLCLAGCNLEMPGTASKAPDVSDGAGPITATEDAGTDASSPDASDADSGDQKEGCSLSGAFALSAQADVVWAGTSLGGVVPVIDQGAGQLFIVTLLNVTEDAQGLRAEVRPCGVYVPDFRSPTIAENYAVDFPDVMWDAPNMPRWTVGLNASCLEPACALESDALNAMLGVDLQDPNGAWPTARTDPRLTFRDDDNDGYLGLTVTTRGPSERNEQGQPYAHPPVDAYERATKIMLGIRVMTHFSGALVSCDEFEGTGPNSSIDTRAISCARNTGGVERECDVQTLNPFPLTRQADFVDGNLPVWDVQTLAWRGTRLAAAATCGDARAAFANHW